MWSWVELGGLGPFVMVRVEGGVELGGAGWTGTLCDGEEGGRDGGRSWVDWDPL